MGTRALALGIAVAGSMMAGGAEVAAAAVAGVVALTGTVSGRVTMGGTLPPPDAVWVTKGGACPAFIRDDRFNVGSDRSLSDSVVTLAPEAGTAVPEQPLAALAPRDAEVRGLYCALAPRVQVVRPGSLLVLSQEPRSGHELHAYRDGNTLWGGSAAGRAAADLGLPPQAGTRDREGSRPRVLRDEGVIDIRCDAGHEWEVAWVYVTGAPFAAVTDAGGGFSIPDVPAGDYTLSAWHPYLGHVRAPIRVDPAAPRGLVVSLSGRGIVETLYPGSTFSMSGADGGDAVTR